MWMQQVTVLLILICVAAEDGDYDEYVSEEDYETYAQEEIYEETQRARRERFLFLSSYFDEPNWIKEKYDFIIVGSGSSGSVLANRLSENKQWNVLLLETGEIPTTLTRVPAFAAHFQFTNYNWGYLMEKQANFCLGFIDQRMHWPRGKVLGGSTIINYMIHVRGNRHDYDRWAKLGNPGWSYNKVLPYFLKSEDANLQYQDPAYHNTGGYLGVQDVPYRTGAANAFVQAARESGYEYIDYNGKSQLGVSYVQSTLKNGLRCSADYAFLNPALQRPNLTILTKSRVVKILIDPTTKRAYGVKFIKNRRYHVVKASKEVILSAGAFNSPQLLMLSGIGPEDHLKELNIPLLQNLPVGQKMYDHLTFLGLVFTVNQSVVIEQKRLENINSFLQFLFGGVGPLTLLGGVEALAYFKTNLTTHLEDYPDMELIFLGGSFSVDGGQIHRKIFRVTDEVYNRIWKDLEGKYAFTIYPMLLHPKSYGHLRLKSQNPFHWPKLYGNYFTDLENYDMRAFLAGIREAQRILQAPAFQRYGIKQVRTPIPGCEHHEFDTDDYWTCGLRHLSTTLHHQISTCKMGPSSDPEAVVDHRLRVYGIKNLRVVDTSIIPLTLSAHTSIPAYMIGEKASDLIKEDWIKEENIIKPKYIRDVLN